MKHLIVALGSIGLVILLAPAWGCTTTLESASTFPEVVRLYRLSDHKKALAVAADEHGKRSWGVLSGSLRQDHANEKALEDCRRNAARAGVQAECYLFAVGDSPAEDTVRACSEGRIGGRRCAVQAKYGW